MHSLASGKKAITTKEESICECPEIFFMSTDEAKSKGLHPSPRDDPDMRETRAPMKSVRQKRRKDAFANDRKRLEERLAAEHHDPTYDVTEETSEDDVSSKHKSSLSCHTSTSLSPSLDLKPSNPITIATSSHHSNFSTHTVLKPAPSTDTLLSPPMSPTCDIDPYDSDDDSLSSDDSIF